MFVKKYKHEVKIILLLQLAVPVFTSIIAWIFFGNMVAKSILWGGAIVFLPNMLMAIKIFRFHGAKNARKIVNSLYVGEFFKFLSTIVLFVVAFKYFVLSPLVMFLSVLVFQALIFLVPILRSIKKV